MSSISTRATGKVSSTTDNRFAFGVLRHDGPVLVDFHALWCRTCQVLQPVLDDLATAWGDRLRIVSIDIERHPAAAQRHHVQSIPTLVLFDHGIEQGRLINVVRSRRIDDWLHDHIDQHSSDPSPNAADHAPGIRLTVADVLGRAVGPGSADRPLDVQPSLRQH